MHRQNFKSLLEKTAIYAKMGSWEIDFEKEEIYWSKVTKLIHEVDEDYQCDFENIWSFYKDPYSLKLIKDSFNKAIHHNIEYDIKVKITTAKSKNIWVRAIGIPEFEDGKYVSIYGLFQNIDKEERKQEHLHKQLQITNDVLKNTSIGIAFLDKRGLIKNTNDGFCQILGYSCEAIEGTYFNEYINKKDLQSFLQGFNKLKEGKIKTYTTEKNLKHKNGNTLHIHLVLTVIRDINGRILNFLAQVIDLSAQYESKQKLTSYLDITTDQNHRLVNFAHIVSHNLKSHSGNLSMLLELMHSDYPELEENELIPLFEQSVDNLSETINHLNEVAAMQNTDKKNIESLNLLYYIEKTLENISALIKSENAHIQTEVDHQLKVQAIPAYLESILLNLLTNAIKYRKPETELKIKIIAKEIDNLISLEVIDNGLGMDLNKIGEKLFGMYKTFHQHKDSRGIGLFITKNQIEALGGSIQVESEINKGSNFKVFLKNGTRV